MRQWITSGALTLPDNRKPVAEPQIVPEIMPTEPQIIPKVVPTEPEIIPEVVPTEPQIIPEVVPTEPEIIPEVVPTEPQIIPKFVPTEPQIIPEAWPSAWQAAHHGLAGGADVTSLVITLKLASVHEPIEDTIAMSVALDSRVK
jgi:hypothetical protein